MPKYKDNAKQAKVLQEEIARLKRELEDKDWVCQKTSEGVKALYKELERHRDHLEEVVGERTERLREEIAGHRQAERVVEERDRAELHLGTLRHENEKLETILKVGEGISSILDLEELAKFVIEKISRVMPCEKASLMVLEEGGILSLKRPRTMMRRLSKMPG